MSSGGTVIGRSEVVTPSRLGKNTDGFVADTLAMGRVAPSSRQILG